MPISKEQKMFWSPFKIASAIGAVIAWLIGGYFSDKIENWRNDMIDNLLANYQETFWGWVFSSPYNLMRSLAVLVFIIICVDAYFFYKKRLEKQKSEGNTTSVFVTNESMKVESLIKIERLIINKNYRKKQSSHKETKNPKQLPLTVKRAPVNVFNTSNGDRIDAVALLVKNEENKKIIELRAEIKFEHFYYQPESKRVSEVGYDLNAYLFWDDENSFKKEINLRPDVQKILILCEILKAKTSDGNNIQMAYLASDPVPNNIDFSKESIIYINVLFQGKLEGDNIFRAFHYNDTLYIKPEDKRILFLEQAEKSYPDIPKRLLERSKDVIKYIENKIK